MNQAARKVLSPNMQNGSSQSEDDMNLPDLRLHPLSGDKAKFWAVDVSGNWRVFF